MVFKYETVYGSYIDSVELFQQLGGRFYPARFIDGLS